MMLIAPALFAQDALPPSDRPLPVVATLPITATTTAAFADVLAQRNPVAATMHAVKPVAPMIAVAHKANTWPSTPTAAIATQNLGAVHGAGSVFAPPGANLVDTVAASGNVIPANQPATPFINGSLFGHAIALPGSSAVSAASAGVAIASGPAFTRPSPAVQTGQPLAGATQSPAVAQAGPAQLGQTPILPRFALSDAVSDISGSEPLIWEIAGNDVNAPTAVAISVSGIDPGMPDQPRPAGVRAVLIVASGVGPTLGNDGETIGGGDEQRAKSGAPTTLDSRDNRVANLTPVHVAAALTDDSPALRILARVSTPMTEVDDQVEQRLLAVARQYGNPVGRLRLNGIDRIVGGEELA